jgi:hypothetical protein
MIDLEQIQPSSESVNLCVFVLDDCEMIRFALGQLGKLPNALKYMIVIPRKSTICQSLVDRSGVNVNVLEWRADILPLANDFFLVPSPNCFRKCFVEDDITDIYSIARALAKVTVVHGRPARVFTAGAMAGRVNEVLTQQQIQLAGYMRRVREFDDLFIFDRTVDLLTPLLTQTRYSGVIDECIGITAGYIKLPEAIVGDDEVDLFSPADELFPQVRGMRVNVVPSEMRKIDLEVAQVKGSLHDAAGTREWNAKALRAAELKKQHPFAIEHFKLGLHVMMNLPLLFFGLVNSEVSILHVDPVDPAIAFRLMTVGQIARGVRFLCAQSLIEGGLGKPYEELQARMISEFGVAGAVDFAALEKSGFVSEAKLFRGGVKFMAAVEKLRVLIEGGEDADLGAVYELDPGWGYVPLLVRLVQEGLMGEWKETGRVAKVFEDLDVKYSVAGEEAPSTQTIDGPVAKKVLVFVIGGVTEQEALVFQQLGRVAFDDKVEIHLASTNVITGSKLITQVCPSIRK